MSIWTYVNGTITIRSGKKPKDLVKFCEHRITGSEGDCEVRLIHNDIITGSRERRWVRCVMRRFKSPLLWKIQWLWKLRYPEEKHSYSIVFTGSLRDRCTAGTVSEINNLLKELKDKTYIDRVGIVVASSWDMTCTYIADGEYRFETIQNSDGECTTTLKCIEGWDDV